MNEKKPMMTRKKWAIVLAVLAALAVVLAVVLKPGAETEDGEADMMNYAKKWVKTVVTDTVDSTKAEVELVLQDIQAGDMASARQRIHGISEDIHSLQKTVNQMMPLLKKAVPDKVKQLEDMTLLLDMADTAMETILLPAIDLLEEYPLSQLKVGDGFNTRLIGKYLDFAESVIPDVEQMLETVRSVDLSFLGGQVKEYLAYLDKAEEILAFYHREPQLVAMLKDVLGVEEDRLYVIAVQNPSEIRASGGFPGSVGTMQIKDGVLTTGEFKSVTYMFIAATPQGINITQEEVELFHHLSSIRIPRDSDLCPDFERVGHIWALAYEQKHGEYVDGVISVTPHIVQRLLGAMDEEIELFDGTTMNGEDALRVLLHDIYYKYFGANYTRDRNSTADDLFAEAAKITMEKLTENVDAKDLVKYVPAMKESFQDRTLMLWMRDEQQQDFISRMGWSGGLNKDPNKPETGIYFNGVVASKMGWYVLMDTVIGERVKNEDGSYTYPVTVTLANNATQEELKEATSYITGGNGGIIRGVAYFFAPAGGTVSNFEASNGRAIRAKTYNGYQLGYMDVFSLKPDEPVIVTYLVTTAPGVETPLSFNRTPTAQDYREFYGDK